MIKKRSIMLQGHATSITLEEPFWQALKEIALAKSLSLNALISTLDAERYTKNNKETVNNLSSVLRCYILMWYQEALSFEKEKFWT